MILKKVFRMSIINFCLLSCLSLCACTGSNQKANELVNSRGYKYSTSSVKTPKGSKVTTWKYKTELSATEKKECVEYVKKNFPSAKKLREPTLKYNCHSYAWYSTGTANAHWMNDPSKYWKDKSYKKYANSAGSIPAKVTKGSKVVYWDGNAVIHSAIVASSKKLKSKWGMLGLYEHAPKDCPYAQSNNTYKLTFYR